MDEIELITLQGLLYYVYNRFAVTYLMCFLGVITGKVLSIFSSNFKKLEPIGVLQMALQGALVTVIMCALQDFINIESFNMYVLLCVFIGIWSPTVVKIITNMKILQRFIVNISKRVKDPIIKAIGDTADQLELGEEDTKLKEDENESNNSNSETEKENNSNINNSDIEGGT